MARTRAARTRTQDARFKGLVMLGLGALGFVAGGLSRGDVPLMFAIGGLAFAVGLVFLIASALMRD